MLQLFQAQFWISCIMSSSILTYCSTHYCFLSLYYVSVLLTKFQLKVLNHVKLVVILTVEMFRVLCHYILAVYVYKVEDFLYHHRTYTDYTREHHILQCPQTLTAVLYQKTLALTILGTREDGLGPREGSYERTLDSSYAPPIHRRTFYDFWDVCACQTLYDNFWFSFSLHLLFFLLP